VAVAVAVGGPDIAVVVATRVNGPMSMTPLTVAPIFRGAVDLRDAVSTRMDVHRRRC